MRDQGSQQLWGCLLLIAFLVLLSGTGLGSFLLNLFGVLFLVGLSIFFLLFALLFGFSFYIRHRVAQYEAAQSETHKRFVYLLVHILVKIAQADGHFTRAELATMTNFFQYHLRYDQDQMYWVKQLIKEARDARVDMDGLLREFRDTFAYEPRLILLELIYQIIHTKSPVIEGELREARRIAAFLQITAYDLRTIEAKYMYGGGQGGVTSEERDRQYYAVLGLEPGADFEAVKKAYRKLSMQYHPDKVAHLGEEFSKVAEEKMREINAAYDYFKKKFAH